MNPFENPELTISLKQRHIKSLLPNTSSLKLLYLRPLKADIKRPCPHQSPSEYVSSVFSFDGYGPCTHEHLLVINGKKFHKLHQILWLML